MANPTELCPIFKNNLVKREIFVPYATLNAISTTNRINTQPPVGNAYNIATIWVRPTTKWASTTGATKLLVYRAASQAAAGTVFASLLISKTYTIKKWYAMTVTKTAFSAAQCIRMGTSSKETTAKGVEVRIKVQDA